MDSIKESNLLNMNFASNTRQIRGRYWVLSGKNSASSIQYLQYIDLHQNCCMHFWSHCIPWRTKTVWLSTLKFSWFFVQSTFQKICWKKANCLSQNEYDKPLIQLMNKQRETVLFFIQQIYYIYQPVPSSHATCKHICCNTEKQQQLLFKKPWIKQLIDITMQRCPCKGEIFLMGHVALTTHYLLCHVKYL